MAKAKQDEYIIVVARSWERLQEMVNDQIGKGFLPTGGIMIDKVREPYEDIVRVFYQAMVKKIVQIA